MKLLTASLLLGYSLSLVPQAKVYEHTPTNFKFSIAGTSNITKKKGDWTITFPVGSTKATAALHVFAVSFMAEPDVWEGAQKYFAEQSKATVMSQTREEILGVPILVTKMQEVATSDRKITISALIYSQSDLKLFFRLVAPEAVFGEAEQKFHEILQTLGTIDGRLPKPEIPGRVPEAPATKNKGIPEVTRTAIGASSGETKFTVGLVRIGANLAGRPVQLCVPKDYTLEPGTDGKILAGHPELGMKIEFELGSSLDSSALMPILAGKASSALAKFDSVKLRSEGRPKPNTAGANFVVIRRQGIGQGGPLYQIIAGAEKGDYYWHFDMMFSQPLAKRQSDLVDGLILGSSVEPAQ